MANSNGDTKTPRKCISPLCFVSSNGMLATRLNPIITHIAALIMEQYFTLSI